MPTIIDLGQKVKAKYPGTYDDLSDDEVGRRVKAKYPEYNDFTDVPVTPSQPEKSTLRKVAESPLQAGLGFIKGAASTLATVPTSVARVVQGITEAVGEKDITQAAQSRGTLAGI